MSMYKVTNPATGEVEKEFPTATDEELTGVLERSQAAYDAWRATSREQRAKILLAVAELYKERVDHLASIITREMGKPTREAVDEIEFSATIYEYYANEGPKLLADRRLESAQPGEAWVRMSPI
ncbi:MAG: aldehyde dehydrogenase family protein, partial [Acidimicrobiales bacterium]